MHLESPPGPEVRVDGRPYLYFAGTGYLGLQARGEVAAAAAEAAARYGIGSATSRGFVVSPAVVAVERAAADFFHQEAAYYYASGYAGGRLLAAALAPSASGIALDAHAHHSLVEAAAALELPAERFGHRDADALNDLLAAGRLGQRPLVMTDGVFSVRGEVAPLADYARVLARWPAGRLLIDDAHGWGVLGANGRGTLEHFGLDREPAALCCGTLSKALGGYGGLVCGRQAFVAAVRGLPYFNGASPPPPPVAAASAKALALAADPTLRARLAENARRLKEGLGRLGLAPSPALTPMACIERGDAAATRSLQEALARRGILVAYFSAYAGLGPAGGVRIAVFATHTPAQIDELLDELARVL